MPKQLNFVPNERVDLNDLTYGTSTFTVDSLKSHVQRLVSGDYHGGFVLEGFRVQIEDAAARIISVHNGIALDRDGRLITFEDGDNFSNNIDLPTSITLTTALTHYVSIDFVLDDVDDDTRAVWDPTLENPNIIDSAGNSHGAPNGRETPLNVPTRRAISWRVIANSTGFVDQDDPGLNTHTLSIPVAIIEVGGGGAITTGTQEVPWTTLIETPQANGTVLACANTRLFFEAGQIEVFDRLGNTLIPNIPYSKNDLDNNALSFQNLTGTLLEEAKAGDIVKLTHDGVLAPVNANYIPAGSSRDARPLLFSFTDPVADSDETPTGIRRDPRNLRFMAAIALLRKYITSPIAPVSFPSATAAEYKLELTPEPDRVEFNLKQGQDLLRSLGALIREMKYGDPINLYFSTTYGPFTYDPSVDAAAITNSATQFGFWVRSSHPEFHSGLANAVGATLTFESPTATPLLAGDSATITNISSTVYSFAPFPDYIYYIVTVGGGLGAIPNSGGIDFFSITKNIEENTKFVDNYNIGNLNEVYRARIDRVTNSWTFDLQERLAANKIPTITVGDGLNTFGDFNGNTGLAQAFETVAGLEDRGGIIYVKQGNYTLSSLQTVKSDTTVMGDGSGVSVITYDSEYVYLRLDKRSILPNDPANNIQFKDISIIAADTVTADTEGRGCVLRNLAFNTALGFDDYIAVTNLVIDNCFMQGGSFYDGGANVGKRYKPLIVLRTPTVPSPDMVGRSDIKITNSRFFIEGSGFYLKGCRSVQIDNCIFETETNRVGTDFVGLVEGIVFDGGRPSDSNTTYGNIISPAQIEGEVSVSNCKFRGPHTELSLLPYRGWIFFSPTFTGQNSSVTNCQFIGDTEGDKGPIGPPYSRAAFTKWGIGIVSITTEIVFINGCMFHSYAEGIRAAAGKTIINNCSYIEMDAGIRVGFPDVGITSHDYAYSNIDSDWVFSNLIDFITEINGCSFSGRYDPATSVGIDIIPNQLFLTVTDPSLINSITVKGCNFNSIDDGISYTEITDYWTDPAIPIFRSNYALIEVASCTFTEIGNSALAGGALIDNGSITNYYAVQKFIFDNNTIEEAQSNNSGSGVVNISARDCSLSNNKISGIVSPETIFNVRGTHTLLFDGNNASNFFGLFSGDVVTFLGINMLTRYHSSSDNIMSLVINNNSITTKHTNAVCNGVHFYCDFSVSGYPVGTDFTDNQIISNLMFTNNHFELANGNFALLARQDDPTANAVPSPATPALMREFVWSDVIISNNTVINEISSTTGWSAYGNDLDYVMPSGSSAQYLGGRSAYCGIFDLRYFRESSVGLRDASSCVVSNNTIKVSERAEFNIPAANKNEASVVGFRVSSFPSKLVVEGNQFTGAPIIIHDNWASQESKPSTISVCNNQINGDRGGFGGVWMPCLLDITPATGKVHGGSAIHLEEQMRVTITGNQIGNVTGQDEGGGFVTSYSETYNVVRLGSLSAEYTVVSDQFVDTVDMNFAWLISDNQFMGIPIIVGYGGCSTTALHNTNEAAGQYLGALTSLAGTIPLGPRLITVENNQFFFVADSFEEGHIFASTTILGVARAHTSSPGGTGTTRISALIVQNNSALLGGAVGALATPQTVHSVSGSFIRRL